MKKYLFSFLFVFSAPACQAGDCDSLNKQNCEVLKNFTVADKKSELHFNHLCSELDNHNGHYQTAYAFFEKADPNQPHKALALVEVSVGWIGYHPSAKPISSETENVSPEAKGIFLELERLQIQSLKKWAGQPFSIALQMRNNRTNETITGEFSKTFSYSYSGSGYPKDKKYILPNTGNLFWEKLKEPEEESPESSERRNEYRISSAIDISSPKIPHPEDPHFLYLALKNETTGEVSLLEGPPIRNLKTLWNIKYSGPRVLNWEVLNPWQEGGLWDWMSDAFEYGDCIYLRKQAKKEFSLRFSKQ